MDPDGQEPAPPAPLDKSASERVTNVQSVDLRPVPEGINCPDCGYDLRALTSTHCPECGLGLDLVRTQTPQIPWARRHELGRFRAYWQTVWLVCRHPQRLYTEMVRPVSYRDAQRFRWATFLHAFPPVVISLGALLASEREWPNRESLLIAAGAALAAGLLLIVLPGAGSYVLESRRLPVEQRNRGIALSYYAWAPLAAGLLTLLFVVAACITDLGWDADRSDTAFAVVAVCLLAAGLFPLATLLLAEARLTLLARRVLRGQGRLWWRIIIANVAALAALALAAVVPLSVIYFMIIWHSFH